MRLTRRQQAGLIVLAWIVLALAIEAAARILTYRQANVLGRRNPMGTYYVDAEPIHDPGPQGDLVPGQSLWMLWPDHPYVLQANAQGLRHDEAVDPQAWRVLALGDSMTLGPYVANRETWPAALETELRRLLPGRPIQVLNAGIPGYSLPQETSLLREKGLGLAPDLILLAVHYNDLAGMSAGKQRQFPRPPRQRLTPVSWLTRHSAVVHALRTLAVEWRLRGAKAASEALRREEPEAAGDASVQAYAAAFAEFVEVARRAGVPVALFMFPDYTQVASEACADREQQAVADLAQAAGIPFLDLRPAFAGQSIEDLFLLRYDGSAPPAEGHCFPDKTRYVGNHHLSRFGYRLTARAVLAWLQEQRLTPP
jgi:lysophospholipase L1-like esterase